MDEDSSIYRVLMMMILNEPFHGGQYPIARYDVYSAPSPQILPFYLCKPRVGQSWFFFYSKKLIGNPIFTRNGYYQRIGQENFFEAENDPVCYMRKFRFYYNKPPHGIPSKWIVVEYGLHPDIFVANEAARLLAADRDICGVAKETISVPYPLGRRFDPSDSDLLTKYLKRNIMGLPIPSDDPIPIYDVFSVSRPDDLPFGFYDCSEIEVVRDKHGTELGFVSTMRFYLRGFFGHPVATQWVVKLYNTCGGEIDHGVAGTRELVLCKFVKDPSGYIVQG